MTTLMITLMMALAPPSDVKAYDTPGDGGSSITIEWQLSPDDEDIDGYEIHRSTDNVTFEKVGFVGKGIAQTDDKTRDRERYYYKIAAVKDTARAYSTSQGPFSSAAQWFNTTMWNVLIGFVVSSFFIIFFIYRARKGRSLYIRKIAGLSAVDDAVGRATEMGKPILYSLGLGQIDAIATIASLNIVGEVAKKCAEFETKFLCPTFDPVVYTVSREIVKQSYGTVGKPDRYDPNSVFYLAASSMAYASGICGIMTRERPATNFWIGSFGAESLILAETGAAMGAIQIAGTDNVTQLPFFITACDYTLIGEELYAASAYISKEPLLLGAIKGEDFIKVIIVGLLLVGSVIGLVSRFQILSLFK